MAKRTSSTIPPYKRRRTRSRPGVLSLLARLLLGLIVASVLWVVLYRFINPPITVTMLGDIAAGRGANREWMGLDRMDRDMVRAAIGAEDSKFCSHDGFDVEAIEDALKRNASGGRIRGGSTISQQTAKNAFLWQGGGYPRKAAEAYFTFLIENLWGKRRIMEVYLNLAETGIGTYGANAGSLRYFGHDSSAMSEIEAARIAAILPLPKKRGAIAPKGFTRRYGNSITARVGVVGRDGLDACVYRGSVVPPTKAPPRSSKPVIVPGAEYESAALPPVEISIDDAPVAVPPGNELAAPSEPPPTAEAPPVPDDPMPEEASPPEPVGNPG